MRRFLALTLVACLVLPAIPATATPAPPAAAWPPASERVVVLYRDDVVDRADFAALAAAGAAPDAAVVRRPDAVEVEVPAGSSAMKMAEELRRMPGVLAVARSTRVMALEDVPPNDTRYSFVPANGLYDQGTYLGPNATDPHSIDLQPAWDAIFNGTSHGLEPDRRGVTVGIVDSGATPALMEDTGRIVDGYDYVNADGDTADDASLAGYHGTKVASIIGSQADNAYGTAGVLYGAKNRVVVYKVLDSSGAGNAIDTMLALMDAADAGVKVINASLGEPAVIDYPDAYTWATDPDYDLTPDVLQREAWQEVVDYCSSKGTLLVGAAGNEAGKIFANGDSYTDVLYPAACDGVLTVGSINPLTGSRSSFSSYGDNLDVMAAGEKVWTVAPNGISSSTSVGTSFAAPLVTGSVALLWSLVPDLTAEEISHIVTSTADASYGTVPGFDPTTGWGRLDVFAAYQSMVASLPVQAAVEVTTTPATGRETTVSWTAAEGSNPRYLYGFEGGPAYETTLTSGRLVLPSDGEHTVWVRSYCDDRFDATRTAEATIAVTTGLAPLDSTRLRGDDRYETAAAVSRAAFPATAGAVVIASGQNWPDGLAASVLARAAGGPLLLTRHGYLSLAARDELLRLKPDTIYIVGGTSAVSGLAEEHIRSLPLASVVTRIGGADRYATAAMIADEVSSLYGGATDGRAIIASGQNYPDALSGSPVAAELGWPILLTKSGTLPAATASAIGALGVEETLVLGGTKVINDSVLGALPTPTRIAGADRYATSRAIADWATASALFDRSTIGLATGRSFPDALGSGPMLAAAGTPLVLADELTPAFGTWLAARDGDTQGLVLLGGPAAVSYDLEFDIKGALRPVD